MTLAWILFASVGLFTARYMREVWEPKHLLGTKAWFAVGITSTKIIEKKKNNRIKVTVTHIIIKRLMIK